MEPTAKVDADRLREKVIEALRDVYDPEIPVNIYDLGLIYGIDIGDNGDVDIRMTLTAKDCPMAEAIPEDVRTAVLAVPEVNDVSVELAWDPPWTTEMISPEAREQLGLE